MQSVALYGRIVVRGIASGIRGIHSEFQAKNPFDKPKEPLHLVTGASGFSKSFTKPNNFSKWTFGDDAYFITRNKVADVIGVADGVGGWRNYGIDPSAFPRKLMQACERLVHDVRFTSQSPAEIIAASYNEIFEQKEPMIGSSTACVVSLHREERKIYAANLGDSGFLVIRDGEIIHQSSEQQHYFNTPYQLAVAPTQGGGRWLSDSPDMAEVSSLDVEDGDIVMLATDGLFDNMSEDMILRQLANLHGEKDSDRIQHAASNLAENAYQLSLDPDYMSPFALSASEVGMDFTGGKPDDITCILARVTHQSDIFL